MDGHTQGKKPLGGRVTYGSAIPSGSQSALGEFYRRMRAKLGAPKAITATAHKLARIIIPAIC